MKKFAILIALVVCTVLARADEVALVTLKVGKEKKPVQFALEFHEEAAPRHVENFKELARDGFYKGVAVHRAFPHTLVQIGDPLSKKKERNRVGTGGPGWTLPAEIRRKHTKGAVSAARLPDRINPSRRSNGSQFFVCLKPMPEYDGQYTVFANVLWGLDVLDAISTRPVDSNDYPVDRIIVRSIKIMPREQLPPPPQPAPATEKKSRRWWQFFG